MDESIVGRRVQIGVFSTIVIIAMRALAGGAGAEFGKLGDFCGIGCVVKTNAPQSPIVFALVVKVGIVVLAHGRFGRGVSDGGLRTSHQNPFLEVFVVGDLYLVALKAAFV